MKSYRFWRFAVVVLAAYAAGLGANGASGAAFTNGDFESPYVTTKTLVVPTGWTTWASAGDFGHQLEPGGTQLPGSHQWYQGYTTTTTSCVGGLYQTFDTTPGASYRIKGYAACVHADMNASIGYNQGGWGGTITWLLTVDLPTTTEWYQINSGTGTVVTATGSSMTIVLRGSNDAPTSKTSRLVKFDNIQVIPECTPPNPPTAGTATANSTSQITWGWTRASGASGEVYRAYDASSGGTLKWTSASQATSYAESSLSTNTLYGSGAGSGNQRHLATYKDCESTTRLALPAKYTLQANATTPTFGTITTSSIVLNTTGPVNLTAGSSGVIFKRGTTDLAKVQALTTTDSGLTANTQYTYTARGVNGDNVASTESGSASKYTLAKAPTYGTSGDVTIQCAQGQTKTDCTAGQDITFTFNNSFGNGASNVGQFGYLWDQNAGDPASWTGEQFWTSGSTLVKQAGTAGQSYYLHIRSYNNDSPKAVNTTVLNLGPYAVPAPTPTAPSAAAATNIGTNSITWNWNDLSDNEDGFKVYDAASGGNLLQTLGENVESWAESNLENNTTYYRWVSAYNEYGDSSRAALTGVSTTIPDCIQNEGFEGTFYSGRAANWKPFGSPTLASSTTAHSGTYSQRSTVNSSTHRGVYQVFNVAQGYWYNAWAWLNLDATTTNCAISLDPDPSTISEDYSKLYGTVGWGRRDVQAAVANGVQATGTKMAVILSAWTSGASGYGLFDDIQLSPGITQPSNATACAGSTATFSITATGTGNTYKWQKNTGSGWADISSGDGSGQDSATYTTPTLTDAMNGYQYRCVVTGPSGPCGGSINSQAATLTVTPVTAVTAHPQNAVVCVGSTATFSVAAVGSGLSYQWQKNTGSGWSNIPSGEGSGQNAATYTTPAATEAMDGYQYRCVVTGTCGSPATSNAATLTVSTGPSAPNAQSASDIGTDSIKWNWEAVSGATGYKLWTESTGGTQIGGTITTNYYTESLLDPDTSYTRYVEAYNACGPSATRTELSASTNTRYCPDNPGYETFIGGVAEYWATAVEAGTTSSWSVSTDSHSGNAQKISWTNTGEIAYVYQRINCTPGASYQVSCWFKIGATPCRAIIRVDPNGGTDPKGSGVTYKEWNDCTAWKSETAPPFVAGPGGVVTIFTGGADRTAESAYRWVLFDDVSVLPADPDAALVNGAGSLAYCADAAPSTIELSLTGGYGIASAVRWYDDADLTHQVAAGSPATIAAPTTTTTYYGVYVDDCGKSGARSVTVTVNQLPPAPTSPNNPSRCGSGEVSFQVTVPEGCSVRWYGSASGGSVLSTDNPYTTTISSTTTFYAASVSSAGCESASRTACTATVNTPPTAAASNNGPVCEGSTLSLTGGPNGMSSYSWAGPNGFTSDEQSPTVSASATVAMGGTYTLTVTDSNGCTATATTNAVVIASPSAAVSGGGTVCAGGSATVQAVLTGTAPWSITWSDSVTQSNVTESPAVRTVSPGSTTTYTVTAVSDANCTGAGSGSAVVTIVDPPSTTLAVTAVPGTVCSGDSSTIRVAGSEAGVSYALFVKGGSQVGADQEGTGGDLDFATGSLTETTTFTVRATRSPCAAVDLSTEPTVVVDDVAPTVLYVTSDTANGTYGANADIDVSVKFSEPVTVGDTETKPRVRLETGTVDRCAEFSGVDTEDTSILHFTYTVQTGDQSADLDYTAVDALELNGGSITDECGNNAVLTLPSPGSEGSLGANKNIVIVTAQPGQISGTVSMETYSDSTYSFSRTVRFAATDSGGELLKTWDVEITFTNVSPAPPGLGYAVGSYTLNDVPEGTAALSAKTNWSLRRRVSVTLDEYGRASDVNFSILGGDLDASNSINILDYVRLKTKWHSSDAAADINADGTVQGLDYSIMKANWFRVGDSQ